MPSRNTLLGKRALDLGLGFIIFVTAIPFLLFGALVVVLGSGFPLFYFQERVGRNGKVFRLVKFRSMRANELSMAAVGQVRSDHSLVTPAGRFVRRFKLDELPQIVHVLSGEMSLVGPRPVPPEIAAGYDDFQRRRLEVRPGMTGWAQVNGNIELSWDERIALDIWYVDHFAVASDLRILWSTWSVVFKGELPRRENLDQALAYAQHIKNIAPH